MSSTRPGRSRLAIVGTALLVLAACSSDEVSALRPPPPLRPLESTTTTAVPDYAAVQLAGVGGRTKATVALGPGQAELRGTVAGPEGPVPGAVVHVERLVGDASASDDVTAGPDGRWALTGVLGGRYRVRAWRVPDLAMLEAEVFFVEATESRQVNLVVSRFTGTAAASAIAPDPPTVGQPANLAFRVTQRMVDSSGTVRTVPSARLPAQLVGPGQWSIASANPAVTDASGSVQWRVTCLAAGAQPLAVTVGDLSFPLTLPPCLPPTPPPDAVPPPDTAQGPAPGE